ncbi:putative ABC transport system permease protein [Fontibacillus panacisegetis]|uniref:Putative ABC transport system permease protein n=1 Tax=Fontibacillus panacisegetis TaxID=670482 RepID=A0A1G7FJM1_9BACL|nr:ABC transporter permease [Fontibacillus panacisegetis]SDE76082.1 putative ABC transport system permease protein [Fontibacillus panacisegetis]
MGVPLIRLMFRKMWNTKWLTLSTLLGLVVAVSFTVSIPMYSDGSLKRVVSSSLKEESKGLPAGSLIMGYQAPGGTKTDLAGLEAVSQYIKDEVPKEIGFPFETYMNSRSIRSTEVYPEDPSKVDASRTRTMTIVSMSELGDQVSVTGGQMYSDQMDGNMLEALMLEEAMYRQDLHVGDVMEYPISSGVDVTLKVKIVGTFQATEETDPYWYQGFEGMMNNLFVSEKVFNDGLLKNLSIPLHNSSWYYAFDLREITTSQLTPLSSTLDRLNVELYQKLKDTKVDISFGSLLSEFRKQSLQMQTLLFTLAAPMIAMVFYYIVMNARQSLDKQQSDIAVLRSRGASTKQIIMIYLLEGLILGAVAMILGPLLGWFMSKSIGSANGFLTFVNRKSIPVGFNLDAIALGAAAVIIAILATLLPAISYARASIVNAKQKQARSDRLPFWQRWFIDIILVGIAGYGFYLFQERQILTFQTGMTTDELQVQPFLFFVPALAIFSIGLFFLRVFPWLLKLIGWLGKKWLPVPYYLSLTQLSRSASSYYPLMILLVLTLGLGVYNASAARTIDLNSTERTLYKYGADVIMKTVWEATPEMKKTQSGSGQGQNGGQGGQGGQGGGQGGQNGQPEKQIFSEPPFQVFHELDGVEHVARVLQTKGNIIISGRSAGQGNVMGVDNVDFAQVAWFRNDLFPSHPYQYLNLLGMNESAALVPSNLAEKFKLKTGDVITVSIGDQAIDFAVYGIIPYWPSQYPDQAPFIVANLDYIYDQSPLIPYEVWLKMKPGALVGPLMKKLSDQGVELYSVKDVRSELTAQSKHPTRGGVFGILSLGFLVSVIVSLIGYVLYWFFNLSGRVVQFGILRAMGLSRRQLTFMLLTEQILTAGLSIVLGIVIGKLVGKLYLPFLQTADNVTTQVPPFRIVFNSSDTLQLYAVVFIMLMLGAGLLFWQIRRLRVHQAVKMGEER